jgi:hypothetical protein
MKEQNLREDSSALTHSEDSAYKPLYGEIGLCQQVGWMGPGK